MAAASPHAADRYAYVPLSGPRQIRVLRLFKSKSPDDPLKGELFERSIDKVFPLYEAVSYTWGGQKPDHHIFIDGKPLAITKNCSDLLYNFRNPRRRDAPSNRRLWIDSICINQNDKEEKATQVEMMGDIYSKCRQVLVWLGAATPQSDLLFQTIRKSVPGWWNPFKSQRKFDQIAGIIQHELEAEPQLILDVGSRPWFTRVWTIQEAAASNFVVLFCGKERLLIGTFFTWYRIALAGVLESYANIPVVLEQLPRNTLHFRIRIGLRGRLSFADFVPDGFDGQFNVTEMMCDVQKCGAFEPKDKIFALHTVLRRAGIVLPPADYKKSLDEIYYTATLAILKAIPPNRGGLDFLHQVTGRENTRLDPAPSWVPDYSEAIPPWPVVDGTSSVTKYMKPDYRFSHNDLHLCSPAIVIDRVEISSTQTTWHPDRILVAKDDLTWETLEADPGKTIRALQNWIRIASAMPDSYHPTAQTKQEAFFATIGAQRGSLDIHQQVNRIRSSRDPTTRDIQHLSTALSQILGGDSTAEIIKNLYTHSFAGDAKTWWSILMANDPSVAGFSIPSLSTILSYPPPTSLIARTFWDNFDLAILNKSAEWKILLALSTVLPGLCESILTVCRGNTFFRTKAGYMGAGPKSIRNGDLIVFIAGISCPMAVRPTGKGYNLVAPMYVHGIMKGEIWEDVEEIYRLKRAREFGRGGEVERYYLDLTLV